MRSPHSANEEEESVQEMIDRQIPEHRVRFAMPFIFGAILKERMMSAKIICSCWTLLIWSGHEDVIAKTRAA